MAAEAGGDGRDVRARRRGLDGAWRIDWDEIPMARLLDDAPGKPAREEHRQSPAGAAEPVDEEVVAAPELEQAPDEDPAPAAPAADEAPPAPPPRRRLRPPLPAATAPAPAAPAAPPPAEAAAPAAPPPAAPAAPPPAEAAAPAAPPPKLPPLPPLPSPPDKRGLRRRRRTTTKSVSVPPPTGGRRRSRTTPGRVIGVLAAAGAIAGGSVYALTRAGSDTPSAPRDAPARVQGSSATPPPATPRPLDKRLLYPKGEAFLASGVRFTVVPDPAVAWARAIAATDPGAGQRWQLVSVLYRNLARPQLLAESLRFRLKDAANNVYEPAAGVGNGGSNLAPATQILPTTLVHGQLAFRVPVDAGQLSLIIDPGPQTRVRVEL